jgi:hypothetical protein
MQYRGLATALALLSSVGVATGVGAPRAGGPMPVATIQVDDLGYRPPGPLYLLARYSSASLDYLDATHLLFTFHISRLMRRDVHPAGQDQLIHAVVIELPSGKVTAQADWRMHDRRKYLWPLSNGKVLIRRGNQLLITDKTLVLHAFLTAQSPLREVSVGAGGGLVVTETDLERHTPQEHERLKMQAELLGEDGPAEDAQINMIQIRNGALRLTGRATSPGRIEANDEGYVQRAEPSPNNWVLQFHPFSRPEGDPGAQIYRLNSTCAPEETFVNAATLLVMTCSAHTNNRLAQAVSIDGKFLWDGSWRANLVWPTIETAENGSDFAISWIGVSHPVDTYDPLNDSDVQTEVVDVIDTHTGMLRFTIAILPVLSAGQNFALSPDGNYLAVLNRGAIEIYSTPEAKPAQAARR